MNLRFTNHAKCRILERKIKMSDIKKTISEPDHKSETFENKIAVRKTFDKYLLEVVYMKDKNKFIIITAYYL